jgi:hypothetical protein
MAENLHTTLESQADSFVSSAQFQSPMLSNSVLLGIMSDTTDSALNSMSTDMTASVSPSSSSNLQHFVTKWLQDRVQYHVYQLKAKSMQSVAFPQQQPATNFQPQPIGTNSQLAQPASNHQPQTSQPQTQQQQPSQPAPTRTGFGFRSFLPWSS